MPRKRKYPEYIIELREQDMTGDMKFLVNLLVSEGRGMYMAVGKWHGKSEKEAKKQAEIQANRWDCEIECKFIEKELEEYKENLVILYGNKGVKK